MLCTLACCTCCMSEGSYAEWYKFLAHSKTFVFWTLLTSEIAWHADCWVQVSCEFNWQPDFCFLLFFLCLISRNLSSGWKPMFGFWMLVKYIWKHEAKNLCLNSRRWWNISSRHSFGGVLSLLQILYFSDLRVCTIVKSIFSVYHLAFHLPYVIFITIVESVKLEQIVCFDKVSIK